MPARQSLSSTGALFNPKVCPFLTMSSGRETANKRDSDQLRLFLLRSLPPLPPPTISKSGKVDFGKSLLSSGKARITSETLQACPLPGKPAIWIAAKSPSLNIAIGGWLLQSHVPSGKLPLRNIEVLGLVGID